MSKILLIIAHEGFQPIEYQEPKEILMNADIEVVTASNQIGEATDKFGKKQAVDITLDQVQVGEYDGIFFIGGPGALQHLDNQESYRIAREAATAGILWGAICIAPRILAHAGALRNKKATGWNGDGELEGIFHEAGAEYVATPVVVDGDLITAEGPDAAKEFGETILKRLNSSQ